MNNRRRLTLEEVLAWIDEANARELSELAAQVQRRTNALLEPHGSA